MKLQKRLEKRYGSGFGSGTNKINWMEILLQTPIDDYRKNAIALILAPYLINIKKVSLSKGDIAGVEKLGHKPILAILTYPYPESRWLFIETNKLSPKVYEKNEIERFSIPNLEEEISPCFLSAIEENKEKAMIGASTLQSMIQSQ